LIKIVFWEHQANKSSLTHLVLRIYMDLLNFKNEVSFFT